MGASRGQNRGGAAGREELGAVFVRGSEYRLGVTSCPGCGKRVLVISRGPHSRFYDSFTLSPDVPEGDRHRCGPPAGQAGLFGPARPGAYGKGGGS